MMKSKRIRFIALLAVLALCLSLTAFAEGEEEVLSFTDVTEEDYFAEAVDWAVQAGITNGVGGGLFAPESTVTRAQAVTFLWRMAGQPEPGEAETFTDVEAGSWYETAVLWAVEQGITNGVGDGLFAPGLTCDRAMCLTLLYRMMGSPLDEAAAAEPVEFSEDMTLEDLGVYMAQQLIGMMRDPSVFPDVGENAYYELAVVWGAVNGVLTDDNTGKMEEGVLFRPTDPCVRAEMVSFLYQTKLAQDKENAPNEYQIDNLTLAVPQEYSELLYYSLYGIPDDESGILITVSEKASVDAAQAQGEEFEGAGLLFSIGRLTEEEARQLVTDDIPGAEIFAKDENGWYYVYYHPTDVRFVRETVEQMYEDQEIWTKLNEWASTRVREDIIQYSEGLTACTADELME